MASDGLLKTSPPPAISPRVLRSIAAVLAIGAVIKGVFLWTHTSAPDFAHPHLDALFHDYLARGWGLSKWALPPNVADPLVAQTPFARPPAYPLFLAVVYKLSGGSVLFARGVQLALGLLGAFFAAKLANRLAPTSTIAPPSAAAVTLLSPTLLYFEGELVAAPLAACVGIGLVLAVLNLRDRPRLGAGLAVGMLIGILGLLRPNLLLIAPIAVALVTVDVWRPSLISSRDRVRLDPTLQRQALVATLAMTVGAFAIILPVTIRNHRVSGEAIFISTNGGLTLLHGNHAAADGVTMSLPPTPTFAGVQDVSPFAYRKMVPLAAKATGQPASFSKTEGWFRSLATTWMGDNFGRFLSLTATKALLLVGPREVSNNKQVELERDANPVLAWLPLRWPLLFLLAAFGSVSLVLRTRRKRGESALEPSTTEEEQTSKGTTKAKPKSGTRKKRSKATGQAHPPPATDATAPRSASSLETLVFSLLFIAVSLGSVVVFLAASRFRAPVVPVLGALGGVGIASLARAYRLRAFDRAAVVALAIAFAFCAVNWTGYEPDGVQWRRDRAEAFRAAGNIDRAISELASARQLAPKDPDVLVALGVAAAESGKLEKAHDLLMRAVAIAPDHLQAQSQLGATRLGLGDAAGAVRAFDNVLKLTRGDATLHYNRGMALGRMQRHAEAKAAFETALQIRPDFAPAKAILERLR